MSAQLNPKWVTAMLEKIEKASPSAPGRVHLDTVQSFNLASQWIIAELSAKNIPFAVYNLGAGVKRIVTNTDTCPCCKRPMKEASYEAI